MTDDVLDPRFERDLRAVLLASEPADVPATLYAFVDAITRPAPRVVAPRERGWDRRALAVLLAAAAFAIVAVGVGSGIIRLPGLLPQVAAPSVHTYRLYYEVTPLDRHTPTSDELERAIDVLEGRSSAYGGSATGYSGAPNTIAVDVVVPADDPGRLAEIRAVLPTAGGLLIGTMNDGPIEVGATVDGRDFEPAYANGIAFTPTLRADESALDIAVGAGLARPFADWASTYPGEMGVITTSDGLVLALAPIVATGDGLSWTIPFTPDQVAAGAPRQLLALFSAGTLQNPVREVAPQGVELAPGITPEPEPTPSPTVAPGNELRLEYQVQGSTQTAATLEVLSKRVRSTGITMTGTFGEGGRITVILPVPADDPTQAQFYREVLGARGRVDFVPLGATPASPGESIDLVAHPPLFSGDQVVSAALGYDRAGGRTVDFTLGPQGAAVFAEHTAAHVAEYFAIVLDGTVISAPSINSPIADGQLQISQGEIGGYPEAQAKALVAIVAGGELPFPLQEVANNVVEGSPTAALPASPTTLSVAGYVAACPAIAGCVYDVQLRSAGAEWRAALTPDVNGQLTPGAGLPATMEPGDYTVTATARRNPDSIAGGMGDQGPVDATCTASVTVAAGDDVMVVSATFGAGACTVTAGVPHP